jgi:alpha-L-arabinofuranosidase
MIWFDNLRSVRTCSYYVQQLYSLHCGTHTLSLTMNRLPISGQTGQDGLFASAVWDAAQQSYILKVVNTSDEPQPFTLQLKGVKQEALQSEVETITLQALNPDEENTVEEPNRIVPQAGKASLTEGQLSTTIAPNTFTVYTIRRK